MIKDMSHEEIREENLNREARKSNTPELPSGAREQWLKISEDNNDRGWGPSERQNLTVQGLGEHGYGFAFYSEDNGGAYLHILNTITSALGRQEWKERDRRLSQTLRWGVTVVCCHMGLVRWNWGEAEGVAGRKCPPDHTMILWDEEMKMARQTCDIFEGGGNRN